MSCLSVSSRYSRTKASSLKSPQGQAVDLLQQLRHRPLPRDRAEGQHGGEQEIETVGILFSVKYIFTFTLLLISCKVLEKGQIIEPLKLTLIISLFMTCGPILRNSFILSYYLPDGKQGKLHIPVF